MAQQSTERACDRCRERRVKCDKRQPTCLRCEKLGKPCPGYDKKRKFVDEGVSLRKKYLASDGSGASGIQTLDTASECERGRGVISDLSYTFSPSSGQARRVSGNASSETHQAATGQARVGSAAQVIASNPTLTGPIEAQSTGRGLTLDGRTGHSILSPKADRALQDLQEDGTLDSFLNDATYDPAWFNLDPELFYANNNNSCGFIPNAHIVDEVDRNDLRQSTEAGAGTPMSKFDSSAMSNLWAPESQLNTSAIITDEREHEMAYLIRHFTESVGPWMDLFDKDEHFAHLVPLKALRDALLRNAIAAVAAKQLGRVKGHKPFTGTQCQKPAHMEIIEDGAKINWFYKAANYYDKAIAFSRTYLAALSGSLTRPSSPHTQSSSSASNSDDLLVAVSIFSLYESLDNMEMGMMGWFQHLTGLKSLLTAVDANEQEQVQLIPSLTVGRRASFWNFARADYQAAYINRQKTLLDTEDLQMWRNCGLQIQADGSLYADPTTIKNDPLNCRELAQLVSHTMIWLVLRVTNYLASDSDQTPSVRHHSWMELTAQLDAWFGNLPETFRPCAQIRYPLQMRLHRGGSSQLTEVFFSINQCAAAIQLYHFVRILLLLNKPSQAGIGVTSRLQAYREISAEAIKHAREIVGIALGRPHPAVRVEMNLPLYVAGGCLQTDEERKVVLELLRAIEIDTGCSTEVKVRSLIDEWGWAQEPEGIA